MASPYDWLTVREAAEHLGCETTHLRALIRRGTITTSIRGRLRADDLSYLNRHPTVMWGTGSKGTRSVRATRADGRK